MLRRVTPYLDVMRDAPASTGTDTLWRTQPLIGGHANAVESLSTPRPSNHAW